MKHLILLAFCLLSFSLVKAQSYSSGRIHITTLDTIRHDSAQCGSSLAVYYAVTIDSSYVGDNISVIDTPSGALYPGFPVYNTTGASPWTLVLPMEGMARDDESVTPGGGYIRFTSFMLRKVETPLDTLRYIDFKDSLWVIPCTYGTISGNVYIDHNTNCVHDLGDEDLNAYAISIMESLGGPSPSIGYIPNFFSPGTYTYPIQQSWMTSCTVSLPPAMTFMFPLSPCFSGSYSFTTLPQTNVDFPLLCSSNIDVQCGALCPFRQRLHTPFFVHPYVSNTGCDSASGTMTMVKDSRAVYDASLSFHPADTVRGDTLIWNYSDLSNLTAGGYWNSFFADVYLTADTGVTGGDTLCFHVYTNIPSADVNPANNDYTVCVPMVYSFDPNSKEVSPAGTGPTGKLKAGEDTLTYTINFQNTGSDAAYNVNVIDTLDSHLDPHSLRILGTSHNMSPVWLTPNVVEFQYNNIMLPDSNSNEAASHGQVKFKIAVRPGVAPGTAIKNTGYIYFDSNPAVITNTTHNTTALPNHAMEINSTTGIIAYPNPATDKLYIEHFNGGEITILGMNGATIIRQNAVSDKTTIDISRLPNGIYMLRTVNESGAFTTKFTKY